MAAPAPGGDGGNGVGLSDGQAAFVLMTANMGEVTEGTAARSHLTDADAKTFAAEMIDMHTAALTREQALLENDQSIAVASSSQSDMLMAMVSADVTQLASAGTGSAYDLTYMCAQVRAHATVVALVDADTASVTNAGIASEMQKVRTAAEMHLEMAQTIVASLAGGSGGGNDAGVSGGGNDGGVSGGTTAACAAFGGTGGV